jgi:hypothetical protein
MAKINWSYASDGWSFDVEPSGRLLWSVWDGGNEHSAYSDGILTADTWEHVAATYDVATSDIRLYINGVQQSLSNEVDQGVGHIPSTNAINFSVGNRMDNSGFPVNGRALDGRHGEVQVFGRVIDQAEITGYLAQGRFTNTQNRIVWHKYGRGMGYYPGAMYGHWTSPPYWTEGETNPVPNINGILSDGIAKSNVVFVPSPIVIRR